MTSLEGDGRQDRARKTGRDLNAYLRYMGLGFTMMGIVLAFSFAGVVLDRWLVWKVPMATIVLSLAGVAGAMLHLFKETGRK